jgi:hypothetical protein
MSVPDPSLTTITPVEPENPVNQRMSFNEVTSRASTPNRSDAAVKARAHRPETSTGASELTEKINC